MLDDLRKRRDDEKTQKRKKQTQAAPAKTANQTTLGFAGAQIMGFGATSISRDAGYATAGAKLGGGAQASTHMAYNQPSYATDQYQMSNPRT